MRILRHPLTWNAVYAVSLVLIANVIVWWTGWPRLAVLASVGVVGMVAFALFLTWLRRNRQRAAQAGSDTTQNV